MKIPFAVLLLGATVLAGCASPPVQNAATSDQVQVANAPQTSANKKCDAMTGSRMGNCRDLGAPDLKVIGGDGYRESAMSNSPSALQSQDGSQMQMFLPGRPF